LNTVLPLIRENTNFKGEKNIFENNFEGAGVQAFKSTFIETICITFVFYLKNSE
jgi:hypothetical protein